MIKIINDSPLYPIANPENIAFFGASNNFFSMGSNILQSIVDFGFEGDIYPVHPKEETVQGFKAYKDVMDLPIVPDLAVFVLPTRLICDVMEACGKKGIRHAVVVTAGFREVGGEGIALEAKLKNIAKKYGIVFVGPNCLGVVNTYKKLNTTFLKMEGNPGFIGLASQSGSLVTQMFNYLAQHGVGFSTAFSIGNAAVIDLVDCLEYLGACPDTKVIAMYVESIDRGRQFVEAARRISLRKPIVAYYVGGSEIGKKATFSHTGSLAGPDKLYDGIFRQSGVIRAHSITDLFDYARALGGLPLPRGRRVAIQTHSGGPGAAAADTCGRLGLELPKFPDETIEALSEFVPHTGSINNPVDITYSKNQTDFFIGIPKVLLSSNVVDMLLMYYLVPDSMLQGMLVRFGISEEDAQNGNLDVLNDYAALMVNMLKQYNKPIAGFTFRNLKEQFPQALMANGIPVFTSPEQSVRALNALVTYTQLRQKIQLQQV
ncbi:MAG: CoA-binding protein [Proteobacteria bacterium]|nr:CoA-binding protein [Pseudomonadota bacterium]MBU1388997.1 CoA-binding protein [Pseudomonadota bacterium]MBU1543549.1 CoA-binding protein [Pseudomonadota bacterium]MBU2430550.1 CoA-binding protein [Pseudomonadota bacterium]MBU2480649.1 CoA-binding protein [Pseudomonadota bacterium]